MVTEETASAEHWDTTCRPVLSNRAAGQISKTNPAARARNKPLQHVMCFEEFLICFILMLL